MTDVLVNGPDAGLRRPRRRPRADRGAVRRRRVRAPAGPAAGRRSAGRRLDDAHAVRRPAPARRHPLPRRAGAAVAARHGDLAAGAHRRRVFTLDGAGGAPGPLDAARAPAAAGGSSPPGWRSWSAAAPARGKTTLLAALLSLVDPRRAAGARRGRLRAAARPPARGRRSRRGRPTSRAPASRRCACLVRQALRMRPDRLVVGEVRGAEVVDLLAALNTGHEGGCGTLHANSAADVPGPGRGARAGRRARRRPRRTASSRPPSTAVVHLARGPRRHPAAGRDRGPDARARRAGDDGAGGDLRAGGQLREGRRCRRGWPSVLRP